MIILSYWDHLNMPLRSLFGILRISLDNLAKGLNKLVYSEIQQFLFIPLILCVVPIKNSILCFTLSHYLNHKQLTESILFHFQLLQPIKGFCDQNYMDFCWLFDLVMHLKIYLALSKLFERVYNNSFCEYNHKSIVEHN